MRIGYARVSTADQNLDLQIEELKKSGCQRIYQEKVSGVISKRLELENLLAQLREKDIVVVWRLDRLARSTRHLLEIVERISNAKASFMSISEPWADTTSSAGRMIMTIFAGIAEFERGLIHERTSVGRLAAKERGVKFGRPKKLNAKQLALKTKLLEEGKSVKEVASLLNVNRATVYRSM